MVQRQCRPSIIINNYIVILNNASSQNHFKTYIDCILSRMKYIYICTLVHSGVYIIIYIMPIKVLLYDINVIVCFNVLTVLTDV